MNSYKQPTLGVLSGLIACLWALGCSNPSAEEVAELPPQYRQAIRAMGLDDSVAEYLPLAGKFRVDDLILDQSTLDEYLEQDVPKAWVYNRHGRTAAEGRHVDMDKVDNIRLRYLRVVRVCDVPNGGICTASCNGGQGASACTWVDFGAQRGAFKVDVDQAAARWNNVSWNFWGQEIRSKVHMHKNNTGSTINITEVSDENWPKTPCGGSNACVDGWALVNGEPAKQIWIKKGVDCGDLWKEHIDAQSRIRRGTAAHELGHALGFVHPKAVGGSHREYVPFTDPDTNQGSDVTIMSRVACEDFDHLHFEDALATTVVYPK